MNAQAQAPIISSEIEPFVAALAERVAETVYARLRADVLMGDDMLVSEDELAQIMKRNPEAARTWARIQFGPQGVRIAGSRKRHYRIGAVRHYLDECRAGARHAKQLIEMQNSFDLRTTGRIDGIE